MGSNVGSLDALRKATSIGPSRATRKIGPTGPTEPRIGPAQPLSVYDWLQGRGGPLPLSGEFGAADPWSPLEGLKRMLGL